MALIHTVPLLIALFFCLAGYNGADVTEMAVCDTDKVATCSDLQIDQTPEAPCESKFKDSKDCYTELSNTCKLEGDVATTVNDALKKIDESMAGCDDSNTNTTTGEDSIGSCTDHTVDVCNQMTNDTLMSFCRMAEDAKPCLEKALETCTNAARKQTLGDELAKINEGIAEKKCCNQKKLMGCASDPITNETLSDENCKKMAETKACVLSILDSCGEEEVIKIERNAMPAAIDDGLKLCENKGYSVETDDHDDHDNDHDHKNGENGSSGQESGLVLLTWLVLMNTVGRRLF